jgi:crotonobetainyl-CoA:carnitine CoA-transferase CaiB-like acyl-CoA transferase
MAGALEGTVVLDMTQALSGPFCGMVLGDIGADVIKIELPDGDGVRRWGPPFSGDSGPTYIGFNRNKRSAVVDLHTAEGKSAFIKLAAKADVVIENFRPGTMDRFGVGYETLRSHNSKLIYCAISGYGQQGPLAKQPAMDLMIQAISGMMSLTGEPDGRPVKAACPISDLMGGFVAAFSILAAVRERDRTGHGRMIDVSMLDAMITMLGQSVSAVGISGEAPERQGNAHQLMAPYQSFRTASREIVISLAIQKRWELLCTLPEFAHLLPREEYKTQPLRNKNRVELCRQIEEIFMRRHAEHWLSELNRLGLPVAPVNSLPEILADPHLAQRGTLMEVEYPPGSGTRIKVPGMPWRDVASTQALRNPPAIGQHTAEVFQQFGIQTEK